MERKKAHILLKQGHEKSISAKGHTQKQNERDEEEDEVDDNVKGKKEPYNTAK